MKPRIFIIYVIVNLLLACSSSDNSMMMMSDDHPPIGPTQLTGNFIDAGHPTSGMVTVNMDRTVMSFENFMTDPGPLLEVYLSSDNEDGDFISLGELHGVNGNYEYVLPSGIDFNLNKYVVIWCVDFSVTFGYAVLN